MEIVWSVVEFTPRWKKLEIWSEWKFVAGGGVHSKMEKV